MLKCVKYRYFNKSHTTFNVMMSQLCHCICTLMNMKKKTEFMLFSIIFFFGSSNMCLKKNNKIILHRLYYHYLHNLTKYEVASSVGAHAFQSKNLL